MKALSGKEVGRIICDRKLPEGKTTPDDDVNLRLAQDWWEEEMMFLKKCGLIIVLEEPRE